MTDTASATEKYRAYVGQVTTHPAVAKDEVNQAMIRHWVEAMGDTNPVYVDDEAARATGRDGVIAPPTMLQAWTMKGLVPPPEPAEPTPYTKLLAELAADGYTSVVATNCAQTYHRELRLGDRLTMSDVITDVSDEKRTGLGIGRFVTSEMRFTDQHGELVGVQEWRILRFKPGTGTPPPPPPKPLRPRPAINRDNAFFFEGTAERKLLIQPLLVVRAAAAPARPMCPECHSLEWDTVESTGRGTVHSYVVNHYPQVPAFDYPLLVALIDLEEGTRLVSNLVGIEPGDVQIGMPVEVEWLDAGEGLTLPVFAPVQAG